MIFDEHNLYAIPVVVVHMSNSLTTYKITLIRKSQLKFDY